MTELTSARKIGFAEGIAFGVPIGILLWIVVLAILRRLPWALLVLAVSGCVVPPNYSVVPARGPGYLPAYPDRDEARIEWRQTHGVCR